MVTAKFKGSTESSARVATSPEVSIIIVNWRSEKYVRNCLLSLEADTGRAGYEVFVVDNNSGDGCGTMLKNEFPSIRFIQSACNLGFARANNLALAQARGRYVLFLNPDTEIRGSAIQTLCATLDALPDAGMVGARLLNTDRTLQTTCVTAVPTILNQTLNLHFLRKTFPAWSLWGMRQLYRSGDSAAPVEAISGACMMVRREIAERVGGFTTDYFMYSEDMDLCVKVVKTGHRIYYVPRAEIVHHAAGSSSQRQETHFSSIVLRESLMRFFELHRGYTYARTCRAFMALVCGLRLLLLAFAAPVLLLHPRGSRFVRRAWSKWTSIFSWCLQTNGATREQAVSAR
jgi:N-acetylglucosaminyl-diphospho-decaprenol L-rhamnosyltransferase